MSFLTAQTSNIPRPRDIQGTVINERPIKYDKGQYGGNFIETFNFDIKTFNETQASDVFSNDIITMTAPYLFELDYDISRWNVFLGDHSKGKSGPGYDLEVTDDGKMIITVYLRKDVYWTDGTRMTADDWVFYHNEIICNDSIDHPSNVATYVELEDGNEEQTYCEKIDRWTFKKVYPRTAGEPELSTNIKVMPKYILQPILDSEGENGIIEMLDIGTHISELIGYGPMKECTNLTSKEEKRYLM